MRAGMEGREEEESGSRSETRRPGPAVAAGSPWPGPGELWVTVPGVGGGASHPRLSPCTPKSPRPRRGVSQ